MAEEMPIYFPKSLYHEVKVYFKDILKVHGLEWDFDEKAWIGKAGKVVGVFEGHKRPALLYVSGTDAFVSEVKEFAESVGAEIRDVEVKDIRVKREEEQEEKKIAKEKEEELKIKKVKEEKEAVESMIRYKLENMKSMDLSPTFMRNWIMMEHKVDVSEALGLKPKESIESGFGKFDRKDESKPKGVSISYICNVGNHKACGGYGCACKCHK